MCAIAHEFWNSVSKEYRYFCDHKAYLGSPFKAVMRSLEKELATAHHPSSFRKCVCVLKITQCLVQSLDIEGEQDPEMEKKE